jgi:hypothetical protein
MYLATKKYWRSNFIPLYEIICERERGSNNIFIPLYSKRLMVLHNITIDTIQNKATRKKVRE